MEDIVYADDTFKVWLTPFEGVCLFRKGHEVVAACILRQTRIILGSEPPPVGPDADIFTQLEIAHIGDEVENLSVHLP